MLVRGLVNKMMDLPSSPPHPSHSPDPVVPTEYSLFMKKYLNFNITHAGSVRGMESRLIASPSVPLPQSANLIRHSLGKGTSFDIHLLCSFRFLWFYIFIFPFPLSLSPSISLSFFLSSFILCWLLFSFALDAHFTVKHFDYIYPQIYGHYGLSLTCWVLVVRIPAPTPSPVPPPPEL